MKKIRIFIIILIIVFVVVGIALFKTNNTELKTIKSEKQLYNFYYGEDENELLTGILCMPFSLIKAIDLPTINRKNTMLYDDVRVNDVVDLNSSKNNVYTDSQDVGASDNSKAKDYSKTNIQVENVDEADINKTDGDYIYSISGSNVIITDVRNPNEIKIASKIESDSTTIPEEILLSKNNDKLVVIYCKDVGNSGNYRYYANKNTIVQIFNITDKENPTSIKQYELYEPYYTSRCIDNKLYVISSGRMRAENKKVIRKYKEDYEEKEIPLNKINYLKDVESDVQSQISFLDLDNIDSKVSINSYLIDISNAYVSEKGIYLLNKDYEDVQKREIKSIFGIKGILGIFSDEFLDSSYDQYTKIYKFNIKEDGTIKYGSKNKIKGQTINQYSLDEKDENLRVALYNDEGARIVIFDKNLNQIGESDKVGKGEKMYTSRFIGDKVYLVTYKTIDPLFVIDLSDIKKPKVLGELKIPGYSTYLHPYDENHLIGIGVDTKETVNRNSLGKVISTSARITGMKMALFDISNVNNPKEVSKTVIGDSRTTSAVLTNQKALLFSKEKNLIAIPVNNYDDEFEIESSNDDYESIINGYKSYNRKYVAEGYLVYNINVEDGFKLKGLITHNKTRNKYNYYASTKLLRGLYIDNNLFTVSEEAIKVNNLDTLEQINELKIDN